MNTNISNVVEQFYALRKGCTNTGSQVIGETKFCTVTPIICGFPVWKFIHVTVLERRIFKWFIDFSGYLWIPTTAHS